MKRHNRSHSSMLLMGLLTAVLLLGQLPALGAEEGADTVESTDTAALEAVTETPDPEPAPAVTEPADGGEPDVTEPAPVEEDVTEPRGGGGTRSLKAKDDTEGSDVQLQSASVTLAAAAPVAASTPVGHNFQQHGNLLPAPGWHGGANNSSKTTLAENDSVPYRLILEDLGGTPDAPVYVEVGIEWDTEIKSQGVWVHAYDFITSYDASHTTNPCAGTAISCASAPATGAIPDDSAITSDDGENGQFKAWGGTIDAVSGLTKTTTSNSKTTRVVVKVVSTGSDVILTWGGHISYRFDWPGENTAADASGASYHMYLAGLNGQGGKEDLQLMAGAVLIPDVSLTKTADILESSTLDGYVGDTVRYTYVIDNGGETGLHNVTLTDDKITGVSLPLAGQTIASGDSYTYTYDYVLQPGDVGTLTNNARVDALADGTDEAIFDTDSATVNVSALPTPDLQISKSASDSSVVPTDSFTYTITATNGATATAAATAVSVTDTVPAGLTITGASFTAPGGDDDCGVAGQAVTCAVGNLDAGDSAVVTISVTATVAACGTTSNDATADGTNTTPVSASDATMDGQTTDVEVVCAPDLRISKSASDDSVVPSDSFTYTVTATNHATATAPATAVSVTDTVPAGLTITAASFTAPGGDDDCGVAGQVVTCAVGNLAIGESAEVTISVTATVAACGTTSNDATADGSNTTPVSASDAGMDGQTTDVDVVCAPSVSLSKSASETTVDIGDDFSYTITATNSASATAAATGLVVNDNLDDDLTLVDASYRINGGLAVDCTTGTGNTVECGPLDLPIGASAVVTINVTATEEACGSVSNQATSNHQASSDRVDVLIPCPVLEPGITLTKTASSATADLADTVTYTYRITNTGDLTLSSVTLDDDKLGAITLTDTLLLPGQSTETTVDHVITAAEMDAGSLTNVATATGLTPSQTPISSIAQATVDLPAAPAIEVIKTADRTEAEPGDVVTYTYAVTNTGNVTLSDVFVDDDIIGTVLAGSLGRSLAAGESTAVTATYTVTEADLRNGGVTNVATAGGTPPTGDPVTHQDTVTVGVGQTLVEDTAFLVVSKRVRGTHSGQRYAFSVDCEGVSLGKDAAFTIPAGGGRHAVAAALPVGTACRIVETDAGGADRTAVGTGGDLAQGHATVVAVELPQTTVTFVNTFADAAEAPAENDPELPATGSRALALLIAALAALALGGTLVRGGRRLGGDTTS